MQTGRKKVTMFNICLLSFHPLHDKKKGNLWMYWSEISKEEETKILCLSSVRDIKYFPYQRSYPKKKQSIRVSHIFPLAPSLLPYTSSLPSTQLL